jgi:Zn-dependent protease with chaperone function
MLRAAAIWRPLDRAWGIALVTVGAVGLLAAVPAPLIPIAEGYRVLCERYPVLAQVTNHLPPLPAALLFSLAVLALGNGAATAIRVLVRALRFNRSLDRIAAPPPPRLVRVGRSLGLEDRLTYLDEPAVIACCYGFVRPRVAVTSELLARLDDEELLAALAHERHHLLRRDPARYLAMRTLAATAFMFPAAAPLRQRLEAHIELAADRAALTVSSKGALAGALLNVLAGPAAPTVGAAALSATEARIAHLAGHPVLPPIPVKAIVASVAVLTVVFVAASDLATATAVAPMICPLCPWGL